MLVNLNTLLRDARRDRYAVPAFDCTEDVLVRAILESAEACGSPVILMCLGVDLAGNGMGYLPGLIRAAAAYHAVPVVLHLDHATDLDLVQQALDVGFTSVMIDGSQLPFSENVRLTKAAVDMAHRRGVSVEGELGHVGGMDLEASCCAESVLTEASDVARFVAETGVDALAVSIGTAHGVYRSLPHLDLDRLRELNQVSSVPLVLHGGSGTPDDQLRAAVELGICKVNIYADLRLAMRRGVQRLTETSLRPDPLPSEIFGPLKEEVTRVVAEKIELLGAKDRASWIITDWNQTASIPGPRHMKTFHHLGLVAQHAMPGETYYESLKVWATDPQRDPNRVEWVRFAADSPLADTPLASMPHISFAVDNLERELNGEQPIVGPLDVAEGVRIAYIMQDGALTEYVELR